MIILEILELLIRCLFHPIRLVYGIIDIVQRDTTINFKYKLWLIEYFISGNYRVWKILPDGMLQDTKWPHSKKKDDSSDPSAKEDEAKPNSFTCIEHLNAGDLFKINGSNDHYLNTGYKVDGFYAEAKDTVCYNIKTRTYMLFPYRLMVEQLNNF